ncbi:HAUS augmin-like complex subunit 7 isoform X2 [Carettochelys insculpta]|uniref:HAUS augmin-like complex subunit 7 isoform X2 n=1 Tax=Carettochelys insculpta TaxID=44489 RepID=UPI003EBE3754
MTAAARREWQPRDGLGGALNSAGKMAAAAAAAVYEQLQELDCPLLDGGLRPEPEDALRLLCTPSARRLELLAWLCARAYPPLQEQFAGCQDAQAEAKAQEMARLGSDLLLCGSDDIKLIKGEASAERQLWLLEQLLDVSRYLEAIPGLDVRDSSSSSLEEGLQGATRRSEELLHEVFTSPSLPALLAPILPPCPSDIQPLLMEEPALHQRHQRVEGAGRKRLTELSRALEEANAVLEQLKAESCLLWGGMEPLPPEQALRSLALAAGDSPQLMAAFRQMYEAELRGSCCCGPTLQPSPCGPLAQRLHEALTLHTQELQALAQLSDTAEQAMQTVVQRLSEERGSHTAMLRVRMEELRQRYQAYLAAAGSCQGGPWAREQGGGCQDPMSPASGSPVGQSVIKAIHNYPCE